MLVEMLWSQTVFLLRFASNQPAAIYLTSWLNNTIPYWCYKFNDLKAILCAAFFYPYPLKSRHPSNIQYNSSWDWINKSELE